MMWHEKKTRHITYLVRQTLLSAPAPALFSLCSSQFLLGALGDVLGLCCPAWEQSSASKEMSCCRAARMQLSAEREQELHPYPRERTGLKDPWVYFPAPPRHVINVIALRFLKSWGGGGKIYFKLLSLLVRVLFVMYFCLQHVVIQLTLLDVT